MTARARRGAGRRRRRASRLLARDGRRVLRGLLRRVSAGGAGPAAGPARWRSPWRSWRPGARRAGSPRSRFSSRSRASAIGAFGGADAVAWPVLLFAGFAAGWTFRFLYDFESATRSLARRPAAARSSRPCGRSRRFCRWCGRARSGPSLHGLGLRAVNVEGLLDAVRDPGGPALRSRRSRPAPGFFFILRRSGRGSAVAGPSRGPGRLRRLGGRGGRRAAGAARPARPAGSGR